MPGLEISIYSFWCEHNTSQFRTFGWIKLLTLGEILHLSYKHLQSACDVGSILSVTGQVPQGRKRQHICSPARLLKNAHAPAITSKWPAKVWQINILDQMKAGIHLGLEESWKEHWRDVNWSQSNVEAHSGTALCVCWCCLCWLYHTLRATFMPDSLSWTINEKEHVKNCLHLLLVTFHSWGGCLKELVFMVTHDARACSVVLEEMRAFEFPRMFRRFPSALFSMGMVVFECWMFFSGWCWVFISLRWPRCQLLSVQLDFSPLSWLWMMASLQQQSDHPSESYCIRCECK